MIYNVTNYKISLNLRIYFVQIGRTNRVKVKTQNVYLVHGVHNGSFKVSIKGFASLVAEGRRARISHPFIHGISLFADGYAENTK